MTKNVRTLCVIGLVILFYYIAVSGKLSRPETSGTPTIVAHPAVAESGPIVI